MGKSTGNRTLGIQRSIWEYSIKKIVIQIYCKDGLWMEMTHDHFGPIVEYLSYATSDLLKS
jgi:hypothetical protein